MVEGCNLLRMGEFILFDHTGEGRSGHASKMGNNQQRRSVIQHTLQRLMQGRGVEGGNALVEEETVGPWQQG